MSAEDDVQHLRLLSIFHYVVAGLAALFSCMFLIHVVVGLVALLRPGAFDGKSPPEPFVGWMFLLMGCAGLGVGWTVAAGMAVAGRFLARRRHHTFCLVMAGLEAVMCNPFGTILGVFTIVVLVRPSVKALFAAPAPALSPSPPA